MTEPQERILSILENGYHDDRGNWHDGPGRHPDEIALQAGFSERDVRDILDHLVDAELAGIRDSGYFLTLRGEAARPYSGVWLDGKLREVHTRDGLSTLSVGWRDP